MSPTRPFAVNGEAVSFKGLEMTETPKFIGFGEDGHSTRAEQRVAELLQAARAAIVPHPQPIETPGERHAPPQPSDPLAQIGEDIATIADALRHDSAFSRTTAAGALDRVRERLAELRSLSRSAGRP